MKCDKCGKEVIELDYELDNYEKEIVEEVNQSRKIYENGVKPEIVNSISFKNPEEVYNYFKNIIDVYTDASVKCDVLFLDIINKCNLPLSDLRKIYVSENEKKNIKVFKH